MLTATLPTSFRDRSELEGRVLRGPVPPDFEVFYRASLRFRPGARIRAMDLKQRHQEWALANGAPSLSLPKLRRAMVNIGHRHMNSNGVFYCDVAFAEDLPRVADNFPTMLEIVPTQLVQRVDAMIGELAALRACLAGCASHTFPIPLQGRE